MKEHCLDLLSYHYWANLKLLEHIHHLEENIFLQQVESVFASISETFFHIYQVDQLWLKRCNPVLSIKNEKLYRFKNETIAEENFKELQVAVLQYLNDHYEDGAEISYQNSTGAILKNNMNEIIHHIVNHGTYHRGNIAAMIRQLGLSGISTDYIQYLRSK